MRDGFSAMSLDDKLECHVSWSEIETRPTEESQGTEKIFYTYSNSQMPIRQYHSRSMVVILVRPSIVSFAFCIKPPFFCVAFTTLILVV